MDLNYVDFAIIGIILVSIFFGFRKGFIIEIFWVLGIIVGIILGTYYQDNIINFVEARWNLHLVRNTAAVFIVILLFTILIFSFLGRIITFFSQRHVTLTIGNRIGGAFFGLVRGVIIVAISVILILDFSTSPVVNQEIYYSDLTRIILHYTLKVSKQVLKIFPQNKALSKIDVLYYFFQNKQFEEFKGASLNVYQEFIDKLAASDIGSKEKDLLPEQIQKLRRERKK